MTENPRQYRISHNLILLISEFCGRKTVFELIITSKKTYEKYWEYLSANITKSELNLRTLQHPYKELQDFPNEKLMNIIKATKKHLVLWKIASASISLLVKNSYNFYCEDLSYVIIPYCDLTSGVFQYTNFSFSNMIGVNFTRAYINSCNFNSAYMEKAEIGSKIITGHLQTITALAVSNDEKTLVSSGYDKIIKLWDLPSFKLKNNIKSGHTSAITGLCLSADNTFLISCAEQIKVWDLKEGTWKVLPGHTKNVTGVSMALGNSLFVSSSNDETFKVWKTENFKCKTLVNTKSPVLCLMMSDNGKLIVTGCKNGEVTLWNLKGVAIASNQIPNIPVRSVFINKKYIVSGSDDGKVILRDEMNKIFREYIGHSDAITCVKIYSGFIFSSGTESDCTVRKWDLNSNSCLDIIIGHTQGIHSLVLAQNKVITAGSDKTIRVNSHLSKEKPADWIECIHIIETGFQVLTGYKQGTVRLWQCGVIIEEKNLNSRVMSVSSYNENRAAGCWNMNIYIWGETKVTLTGHTDGVITLQFLDSFLFSGASDGTIKVWLWNESLCINSLPAYNGYVHRVVANNNFAIGTSGCSSTKITIWNLVDETSFNFFIQRGRVKALALNESYFATGGSDTPVIELWYYSGMMRSRLSGHTKAITDIVFYLSKLVSSSEDKSIIVWDWENSVILEKVSGCVASKIWVSDQTMTFCENKGNSLQFYTAVLDTDVLKTKMLWRTLDMFECKNSGFRCVKGWTREEEEELENYSEYIR